MTHGSQRSLPVVGVMGSGTTADRRRCHELGAWLATERVHLLTGGGEGVMDAVSQGFFEVALRAGLVLGILPSSDKEAVPPEGYPNRWVELPIQTHLPLSGTQGTELASRNHINVLSSDVVVALPGSSGTLSEVNLALRYEKPVVAYLQDRSEIPQLPDGVLVLSQLEDLQAFILDALGRTP